MPELSARQTLSMSGWKAESAVGGEYDRISAAGDAGSTKYCCFCSGLNAEGM
jgi:hypothetical protein